MPGPFAPTLSSSPAPSAPVAPIDSGVGSAAQGIARVGSFAVGAFEGFLKAQDKADKDEANSQHLAAWSERMQQISGLPNEAARGLAYKKAVSEFTQSGVNIYKKGFQETSSQILGIEEKDLGFSREEATLRDFFNSEEGRESFFAAKLHNPNASNEELADLAAATYAKRESDKRALEAFTLQGRTQWVAGGQQKAVEIISNTRDSLRGGLLAAIQSGETVTEETIANAKAVLQKTYGDILSVVPAGVSEADKRNLNDFYKANLEELDTWKELSSNDTKSKTIFRAISELVQKNDSSIEGAITAATLLSGRMPEAWTAAMTEDTLKMFADLSNNKDTANQLASRIDLGTTLKPALEGVLGVPVPTEVTQDFSNLGAVGTNGFSVVADKTDSPEVKAIAEKFNNKSKEDLKAELNPRLKLLEMPISDLSTLKGQEVFAEAVINMGMFLNATNRNEPMSKELLSRSFNSTSFKANLVTLDENNPGLGEAARRYLAGGLEQEYRINFSEADAIFDTMPEVISKDEAGNLKYDLSSLPNNRVGKLFKELLENDHGGSLESFAQSKYAGLGSDAFAFLENVPSWSKVVEYTKRKDAMSVAKDSISFLEQRQMVSMQKFSNPEVDNRTGPDFFGELSRKFQEEQNKLRVQGLTGQGGNELLQGDFKEMLTLSESSGRTDITRLNKDGREFGGLLQVGEARLQDFNKANNLTVTFNEMVTDEEIQETVNEWHLEDLHKYIRSNSLDDFIGEEVNGVSLSLGSLMAVAHLGGKQGLVKFLESEGKYNPSDELGTSLTDYAKKFKNTKFKRKKGDS